MNASIRRSRRAPWWAALFVVVLTTGAAVAQQPTSRPGAAGAHRPMRGGGGGGGMRIDREDLNEAMEFTRKYMPNLGKAIEEAEPGSPPRQRLMRYAVERWRSLQRVQRDDPDQYYAALERLKSHDEVFTLVRRLNEAPEDQRPALQAQVRERMRQIMLDLLAEREQRIENLRRMLSREEELLNTDRDQIDDLTEKRVEQLQREFREMRGTTSAGDLTPPDLSTAPADPSLGSATPSTAPSNERPRRDR
jgi:hypothetical protein